MAIKRWDEIFKRVKKIKTPIVIEIGVDNGKLSKQLLSMHPGLTLVMVDRWSKPPKDDTYINSGASIPEKPDQYFIDTFNNCKTLANKYKTRTSILRGESCDMALQVNDKSADLIFIDADHSYQGCKKDIIAWLPKVKSGGYLSGHDYAHPDQGEVKKAVDEMFGVKNIVLGENRTWFYKVI